MKFHFKTAEPDTDIRYDPELAGGALRDVGCYCVSMASYLAGAAPDTVAATARMSESGIDEQFSATLGFGNELLAVFDCGMYSPLDVGVEVLGTDGRAAIVSMPWYAHLEPLSIELERDGETTEVPTPGPNAYRLEIDNVCAAARGEADARDLRRGDAEKPDNDRATAGGRRARPVPCGLRNQCRPPSNNPKRRTTRRVPETNSEQPVSRNSSEDQDGRRRAEGASPRPIPAARSRPSRRWT